MGEFLSKYNKDNVHTGFLINNSNGVDIGEIHTFTDQRYMLGALL